MTTKLLVPFYYLPYYAPSYNCDITTIDVNSPFGWLVLAFMLVSIAIMLFLVFDLADELFGRKVRRLIRNLRRRKK